MGTFPEPGGFLPWAGGILEGVGQGRTGPQNAVPIHMAHWIRRLPMTLARRVATSSLCRLGILFAVVGLTWLPAAPGSAQPPGSYHQTNLAADQAGVAAIQDPSLVGAWGIALSPTGGTFWVSSSAAGVAALYTGDFTRPMKQSNRSRKPL
jgi:hypothetical protein